jgi:class 3 adenylate cyclase
MGSQSAGVPGVGRPSGTVAFLFTDIEASTRLWEERPEAMGVALGRHDEILEEVVTAHDGAVFSTAGDGWAVAFPTASKAAPGCVSWPPQKTKRVSSRWWPPR